jgi:serine/threonine protein kinase
MRKINFSIDSATVYVMEDGVKIQQADFRPKEQIGTGSFAEVWRVCGETGTGFNCHTYSIARKTYQQIEGRSSNWSVYAKQEIRILKILMSSNPPPSLLRFHGKLKKVRRGQVIARSLDVEICASSLEETLKTFSHKGIRPDIILSYFTQIACALAHLHRHRIIHQDIKPGNILLRGRNLEIVKIADFGLSLVLDDLTTTQTMKEKLSNRVGTSVYIPVEREEPRALNDLIASWGGIGICEQLILAQVFSMFNQEGYYEAPRLVSENLETLANEDIERRRMEAYFKQTDVFGAGMILVELLSLVREKDRSNLYLKLAQIAFDMTHLDANKRLYDGIQCHASFVTLTRAPSVVFSTILRVMKTHHLSTSTRHWVHNQLSTLSPLALIVCHMLCEKHLATNLSHLSRPQKMLYALKDDLSALKLPCPSKKIKTEYDILYYLKALLLAQVTTSDISSDLDIQFGLTPSPDQAYDQINQVLSLFYSAELSRCLAAKASKLKGMNAMILKQVLSGDYLSEGGVKCTFLSLRENINILRLQVVTNIKRQYNSAYLLLLFIAKAHIKLAIIEGVDEPSMMPIYHTHLAIDDPSYSKASLEQLQRRTSIGNLPASYFYHNSFHSAEAAALKAFKLSG